MKSQFFIMTLKVLMQKIKDSHTENSSDNHPETHQEICQDAVSGVLKQCKKTVQFHNAGYE